MAERIELPQTPAGSNEEQLRQMYSYLYRTAQALNHNMSEIGSMDLTDDERQVMQAITAEEEGQTAAAYDWQGKESLKSLIIKTAAFVQNSLNSYRMNLLGQYVADGKFGRYVRNTGLKVDVTPEGIQQDFTFEEVVQGLKNYTINAKNYIKTGLLRTVNSIPVYGVAIGKDVVTFAEDGTETYNDGNKVAELTADELSFYQGGNKVASYAGTRISFLQGGSEVMYIQNGEIYCVSDIKITSGKKLKILSGAEMNVESGGNLKVASGGNIDINGSGNLKLTGSNVEIKSGSTFDVDATNFKISSTDKSLISGEWKLNNTGLIRKYKYGNPQKDVAFAFGEYDYVTQASNDNLLAEYSGFTSTPNHTHDIGGIFYFIMKYPDGSFHRLELTLADFIKIEGLQGTLTPNISFAAIEGILGSDNNVWDIYGKTIKYTTLIQNSSKDVKHDIEDMPEMGEQLDRLRPVTFVYDDDPEERTRYGLIYEETAEVMPEICTGDESAKAINYVEMIPMLLKEIQDLRARVKQLEEREEQ